MVRSLDAWVGRQAGARPDAVALVSGETRLTYGELDAAASRLAQALRRAGCIPGDRVAFLLPKSPAAIVSVLGILRAGGVYTPFDTASPAPRLARMLDVLDARLLLAAGPVEAAIERLAEGGHLRTTRLGWLDPARPAPPAAPVAFTGAEVLRETPSAPDVHLAAGAPAYILFTSGSTGVPKGVVITHKNVQAFVDWAVPYFGIQPGDRQSGHIPLHFDLSVFDLFGAFAAGAELYLVPPELNLLPHRLAEFMREAALTQWFSVPSILTYLAQADALRHVDLPSLRRVLWCGEVLPTRTLLYWMRRLPQATFTNLYGPTEATIASTYYTVPAPPEDERASLPIGAPCPGEDALVLDEALRRVPAGESGELYLAGVGLSPGYWRDPERTAAAFLPHPFAGDPHARIYRTGDRARVGPDGLLYFLGRADTQIKSRGYRIELGEIEAAVNTLAGIREAAVVARATDGFEGAVIGCAYVPVDATAMTPVVLRRQLSEQLPAYMLPHEWLSLPRLPQNANGKVDRPALRETFASRAPAVEERHASPAR